jgi:hypothetical protein
LTHPDRTVACSNALLAILGVDLIVIVVLLATVRTRRRWVSHQPGRQMTMTINRRTVASQADHRTPAGRGTGESAVGLSSDHHLSVMVIALAVAARVARDPRTYEIAIMVAITVAAVAGLGRASGARSVARVAAWDKRRSAERTLHTRGAGKPRG